MNKKEQLLAQLAELEAEPQQTESEAEERSVTVPGNPFDPLPESWKPEPRYLKPEDCQDRRAGFRVGDWWIDSAGKKEFRQAYPRPSYADVGGRPGDLITNELTREYFHQDIQWAHAGTDLESCISYVRQRLIAQGHLGGCAWLNGRVTGWEESDEKRRLAEKWNYLLGLWVGRGMQPISDAQLEVWAKE